MGRKTRVSKGKTMKPNFFVFCEGETEVTYVKFLRSIYRVPIQIIPKKIALTQESFINDSWINRKIKSDSTDVKDRLMKINHITYLLLLFIGLVVSCNQEKTSGWWN